MPVALHVASDHGSIQHIERGKQGRSPIAFVVMRHGRPATTLERQARLRAIERLNLALFIDRKHDGMSWWRDVELDDIVQLLGEGLVIGKLETAPAMRRKTVIVPDIHDC